MSKATIAAVVLTFNEEQYIGQCLRSLRWVDELWVVDSFSNDSTPDICKSFGCGFQQHRFESFAGQRQWAVDTLPIGSDWIFFVDADEVVTPYLAEEIREKIEDASTDGYYVPLRQFFWGKEVRYGEYSHTFVLRIHRVGKGKFNDKEVHELIQVDGKVLRLKQPMLHYARRNISEHIIKIDKYSTLEAQRMFRTGQDLYSTASKSFSARNMLLKRIFRLLPCKALCKFIYEYIICRGFMDGRTGFAIAIAQSLYVYLSYFKLWEMKSSTEPQTSSIHTKSLTRRQP